MTGGQSSWTGKQRPGLCPKEEACFMGAAQHYPVPVGYLAADLGTPEYVPSPGQVQKLKIRDVLFSVVACAWIFGNIITQCSLTIRDSKASASFTHGLFQETKSFLLDFHRESAELISSLECSCQSWISLAMRKSAAEVTQCQTEWLSHAGLREAPSFLVAVLQSECGLWLCAWRQIYVCLACDTTGNSSLMAKHQAYVHISLLLR